MLDQSNLSVQRCRLIFWVECSVGGYLALAKTIRSFLGINVKFKFSVYFIQAVSEKTTQTVVPLFIVRFY
jgi:hypothetical protein